MRDKGTDEKKAYFLYEKGRWEEVMEDLKHLVELSKKGDQQAIAQLYEQTSRRAYYLAKQLVKDEDQAQDIVQDAYVKVFTNLPLLE